MNEYDLGYSEFFLLLLLSFSAFFACEKATRTSEKTQIRLVVPYLISCAPRVASSLWVYSWQAGHATGTMFMY